MTHRHPPLRLASIDDEILPPTCKGIPQSAVGRPLHALGTLGLSVLASDVPFPAAVLKDSAIAHNEAWMAEFVRRAGAGLCPHGKTTMAPQLFERQLRAGCWGITAATAAHVRTYRHFGVKRILLANQLVDRGALAIVLDELRADPDFEFLCLVDSLGGLDRLRTALVEQPVGRPVGVLLEAGAHGGRTGVRTVKEGHALGRAIRDAAPHVALRGIEAFEGIVGGADHARIELGVHGLLQLVAELHRIGCEEQWFAAGEILVSAGGSAFFDIAAQVLGEAAARDPRTRVMLRSGCYLTHDALFYERMQWRMRERAASLLPPGPGLRNALEVWTVVQSVPEPGRAICAIGKRDISYDMELPRPIWWYRPGVSPAPQAVDASLQVKALNDQHAWVDAVDGHMPWEVGDLVGFGVAHPCTTFDKWPLLLRVDDGYRVTGGVRTFF